MLASDSSPASAPSAGAPSPTSSASQASFVSMPTMSLRMPGSSATWRA